MIGQTNLIKKIDSMPEIPRFLILIGPRGSGKSLLAKYISKKFDCTFVNPESDIEGVRETIKLSYSQSGNTLYYFKDSDKMSSGAKNALLKVTEEPPQKSFFIISSESESNILETLRSRSITLTLENYSRMELFDYALTKNNNADLIESILDSGCVLTPGDIEIMLGYNVVEFNFFIKNVIENIFDSNFSNVMKIPSRIKTKEDGEGYDLTLFMRALMNGFYYSSYENREKLRVVKIISKYLNELKITGINKAFLLDQMIIELRGL